ncbi:MAG: sigma-54-dependent transcriptional regulator, partial [Alphaproteobacteria bacterium]
MRLMIVGRLDGHISQAGKIALQRGAKVVHCEDTEEALGALLNGKGADLAMVDVKQKIGEFVERLKTERIHMPVVACGIGTDARSAVKAIQDGAKEYVPLPPDAELIAAVLEAVSEENNAMIADDPSMKVVVTMANKVAPSEATILITGESGTGKEVMSRHIHNKSKRNSAPFIAVNCAAIPENLLESELFGHEKGAFTGATNRRIGKFEEAHTGTLLLDEVSEMHPLLQAKLLRAIQEKEITRIGSNNAVKVDVRIIATSNRNLEDSVRKGEFREDLYFRLNVVNLALPPLL